MISSSEPSKEVIYTTVPRMPTVMVEVWISKDSFSSSFSCTSSSSLPEESVRVMRLFSLANVTWVMESRVRILASSKLTDAMAFAPVDRLSPLLKRTFSIRKRVFPSASKIYTSPS